VGLIGFEIPELAVHVCSFSTS